MNKTMLLDLLKIDTNINAGAYYSSFWKRSFSKALEELNTREPVELPAKLQKNSPQKMLSILRKHFEDDVTMISFILNHYFPKQYLFYRVSKLEQEIFAGFEFFAEIVPEFDFPFRTVGKKGFARYLKLNEALLKFAHKSWPKDKKPNARLMYFLYQGLGEMFLEKSDYNRYWVMMARSQSYDYLKEPDTTWSARKEIQAGDLVFMYRAAPHSAITDVYRVADQPYFEPGGAWDGFWVDLKKVCALEPIPIAEMRTDPIINQWSSVRRNFIGLVTDPIPHAIYNGLLTKIPQSVRKKYDLKPEPVVKAETSGRFALEADFEKAIIIPLLKKWAFQYKAQYACYFQIGSQQQRTKVDFFVSDQHGQLTLFEDKLRILNDKDQQAAVAQAKSYALQLGLPSFVVASPEGLWLYALNKNMPTLTKHLTIQDLQDHSQEEGFRDAILHLRS